MKSVAFLIKYEKYSGTKKKVDQLVLTNFWYLHDFLCDFDRFGESINLKKRRSLRYFTNRENSGKRSRIVRKFLNPSLIKILESQSQVFALKMSD